MDGLGAKQGMAARLFANNYVYNTAYSQITVICRLIGEFPAALAVSQVLALAIPPASR
jgi:hypothetical protein